MDATEAPTAPAPFLLRGFDEAAVVTGATVPTVPTVPAGTVPAAVVPITEPAAVVWVPEEPVAVGAAPFGRVRVRGVTATPPWVQACPYSGGG